MYLITLYVYWINYQLTRYVDRISLISCLESIFITLFACGVEFTSFFYNLQPHY